MKYRRYKQEEKMEIIKIVEGSELGVKPTLKELNIHSSTFYKWYGRYHKYGFDGLAPKERKRSKFWNKIPDKLIDKTAKVALDIALKHTLPKLSIEKHINEDIPQDIQITFVDSDGNEKVNRKSLDNFKFKDLAG